MVSRRFLPPGGSAIFIAGERRGDEELRRAVVGNMQRAEEIILAWKEGK